MRLLAPVLPVILVASLCAADPLPGTQPLTAQGDFATQMVSGIDAFLLRETADSIARRAAYWHRDSSSAEKYVASVAENRAHLAKILGVVDARQPFEAPDLIATTDQPALVGRGTGFEAFAIRWPVIGGIHGEGLLLVPTGKPAVADVVAIPEADQTPEMIAGLAPGVAPESQFARRLAENGCRVVIPTLVDRSDAHAIFPSGQKSNQSDREYVYRPAFEMGRHVIGYEVQKVLAAVDWFTHGTGERAPVGVIGYGEGGMLAFYAAALDTRIQSAAVSGYFTSRQDLWQEPIYRNLFGFL
ncbi:MAG TPA: dienelactone hydrolase family protein, partial [Tepidisphaeraceae bacterium]|nr:dienelactone hydrolase family protein [Tepidisphaeraceae bacterium]